MTDGPRIMPHPDDPPAGATPRETPPKTPSEPAVDVESVLAAMPARIESTTEQDGFGQWALGVGGLSAVLMIVQYTAGGMPLFIPAIVALGASYLGVRGLLAARRGLASNSLLSLLGIVAAGVALVAILVYYLVIAPAIAPIVYAAIPAA